MERKKGSVKVAVIGGIIVALAVVLVLCVILIPRASRKRDMKELLLQASAADAQRVVLVDPSPAGDSPYDGSSSEVLLTGEALAAVQQGLADLLEDGFRYEGEAEASLHWDIFLRVKTADGSVVQLYFTEGGFYYQNGAAVTFKSKNATAYVEYYQMLQGLLAVA